MPGYTAECMTGQHRACTDHDCRCGCHMLATQRPNATPSPVQKSTLICPACGKPQWKDGDQFCRQDGVRLIQGKRCSCGAGAEPTDLYCGACGQRFGDPAVKVPDLSEEEITMLERKARQRPSDVEVPPQEIH